MAPLEKNLDLTMESNEIPPVVHNGNNMLLSLIPLNKDEPKVSDVPLKVAPLRMILVPYGGTEPIPFSAKVLARLKKTRKEVPIPTWLKSRNDYVAGDWKAFLDTRSNGHKDAKYIHKDYSRELRSKNEVILFMEAIKSPNPTFRGSDLRKKKTHGPDGRDTDYFKASTRGKTHNGTAGANVPVSVVMPPGASSVAS